MIKIETRSLGPTVGVMELHPIMHQRLTKPEKCRTMTWTSLGSSQQNASPVMVMEWMCAIFIPYLLTVYIYICCLSIHVASELSSN
jgi:hypothetical protein